MIFKKWFSCWLLYEVFLMENLPTHDVVIMVLYVPESVFDRKQKRQTCDWQ